MFQTCALRRRGGDSTGSGRPALRVWRGRSFSMIARRRGGLVTGPPRRLCIRYLAVTDCYARDGAVGFGLPRRFRVRVWQVGWPGRFLPLPWWEIPGGVAEPDGPPRRRFCMVERLAFPGAGAGRRLERPERRAFGVRSGSSAARGYNARWRQAREQVLLERPLCEVAQLGGVDLPSDTVDHLYPHCGIKALFWRREWWVSCDGRWHSGAKQRIEGQGVEALDALALRLGRPLLSREAPDLYRVWRAAFDAQRGRGVKV